MMFPLFDSCLVLSCLHNPNVSSQASAFEKCREPTFSANPSPTKYLIFRLFFKEKREISFFWFLHVFFTDEIIAEQSDPGSYIWQMRVRSITRYYQYLRGIRIDSKISELL